jgi:uncharacterized protein
MKVFADTSAFLALLAGDDRCHTRAVSTWDELERAGAALVTSSYVVIEANAIIQRRLGMAALEAFTNELLKSVAVFWMTRELHEAAAAAQLVAARRELSLVDCSSFQVMRHLGIGRAFTFDEHFREQGFTLV